jgi:hypothetical protein
MKVNPSKRGIATLCDTPAIHARIIAACDRCKVSVYHHARTFDAEYQMMFVNYDGEVSTCRASTHSVTVVSESDFITMIENWND